MQYGEEALRWGGPAPGLRDATPADGAPEEARGDRALPETSRDRAAPRSDRAASGQNGPAGDCPPPAAWETGEWVARLRAGDRAALARFAEDWGPRLYRYLARRVFSPETARDLTQESLLRALEAIRKGSQPRDLAAWLYRIATNLVRDEYRRAGRDRDLQARWTGAAPGEAAPGGEPVASGGTGDTLPQAVIDRLRREAVREAIRTLPAQLQEVLVLRYYEALSVEQIAAVVGIPPGTVKSRLYRAYRRLEHQLAPWRDPPPAAGPEKPAEDGGENHGR